MLSERSHYKDNTVYIPDNAYYYYYYYYYSYYILQVELESKTHKSDLM